MTLPFENNTTQVVKRLAKNSLKSGKLRNILIVLAIALSVALMSGLALYIASMETSNSRQLNNLQQVFFYDITMLLPVAFAAINRSLLTGVSFAMCFIAMTTGYTFSVTEKNSMERLYGILPIKKSEMVRPSAISSMNGTPKTPAKKSVPL